MTEENMTEEVKGRIVLLEFAENYPPEPIDGELKILKRYGRIEATGIPIKKSEINFGSNETHAIALKNIDSNENLVERMRIHTNGNVGIGEKSPLNILDVKGSAVIGSAYSGTNTATPNGLLVEGNVGIGTPTPENKLDVKGGAVIGSTYSGTNTAPSNGLLVEGNVGIGTPTPQNKLDVEGGAVIGSAYSGTKTASSNGLLVEGNVGIGTTDPSAKLTVKGESHYQLRSVRRGYGSYSNYLFKESEGSFPRQMAVGDRITIDGKIRIIQAIYPAHNYLKLRDIIGYKPHEGFYTDLEGHPDLFRVEDHNGDPKLLLSYEGKLGIGTEGIPSEKLEVNGTVKATAFVGDGYNLTNLDASKITAGTFSNARIPNLNASKINAGTFSDDQIPNLNASKITEGTFSDARIPNLNASKITSGTFNKARIPSVSNYFQFRNLNHEPVFVGTQWVKLITTSGTHSFIKSRRDTKIEVHVNSRFNGGIFFLGAYGIGFQVRIDDNISPNFGNYASILTTNTTDFLSIYALFENLTTGTHTVSLWATTNTGYSTSVLVDPQGWEGRIIVKESW